MGHNEAQTKMKIAPDDDILEARSTLFEDLWPQDVSRILGRTIIDDYRAKVPCFYLVLLVHTKASQAHVMLVGKTSEGKTKIALEVLDLYSRENIIELSGASAKSLIHSAGKLMNAESGEPIPPPNEWMMEKLQEWDEVNPKPDKGEGLKRWDMERNEKKQDLKAEYESIEKIVIVDLRGKILFLKDSPDPAFLETIRSALTDGPESEFWITDKNASGSLRTKKVKILGPFSCLYCTANLSMDEQEQTRFVILNPENTSEKISKVIQQQSEIASDPVGFRQRIESDPERQALKERITAIRKANVANVRVPEVLGGAIRSRFLSRHKKPPARLMRDYPRCLKLIMSVALLNFSNRERIENDDGSLDIIANEHDVEEGYALYELLADQNELGLTYGLEFFKDILRPELLSEGSLTRADFSRLWSSVHGGTLTRAKTAELIDLYKDKNFITEERDPEDRRRWLTYLTDTGERFSVEEDSTEQEPLAIEEPESDPEPEPIPEVAIPGTFGRLVKHWREEGKELSGFCQLTPDSVDLLSKGVSEGLIEEANARGWYRFRSEALDRIGGVV